MKSTLKDIAREIKRCVECRKGKQGLPVPGEGPPHAKLMFVGMAPGKEEAETGRPFIGRSGKLLTRMLKSVGIDRKKVYVTSPVKYYPGNRRLYKAEIEHGARHLRKQIDAISPKIIVLMGNVAVKALLPDKKPSAMKDHGKIIRKKIGRKEIIYFLTFHPAAALRFKRIRMLMKKDFLKLKALIDYSN